MTFTLLVFHAFAVHAETVALFGFPPNGYPMNAVSAIAQCEWRWSKWGYNVCRRSFKLSRYMSSFPLRISNHRAHSRSNALGNPSCRCVRLSILETSKHWGRWCRRVGVLETCTIDGNGGGTCVSQDWPDGRQTVTTTFSSTVTPFYTLTVGQTPTALRNEASRIGAHGVIAWGILSLLSYLL
ncbi:hypothetical protein C8R44DRAFT_774661, partial [Mycena epipterygia]